MTTRSKANSQPTSSSKSKATSKTSKTRSKTTAPAAFAPKGVTKPRASAKTRSSQRPPPRDPTPARSASPVSSGTVSPDVIEETPPPASQLDQIASLLKDLVKKKHRSRSRRSRSPSRHRSRSPQVIYVRRRRDSSSGYSSSDSGRRSRSKVSFQHNEGNKPFLKLHEQFRAVDVKYFKQIFYGTFKPKNLVMLAQDYADWATKNSKGKKDEVIQEASGLSQLLRCFDVYCTAICFFAARPHVALQLHEALIQYRIRLSDFSVHYRFDSIRAYHYAFMSARMLNGQDNPLAWTTEDQRCLNLLVRRAAPTGNDSRQQASTQAPKSSSSSTLTCNNFNANKCSRGEQCKYAHVCSNCQQNHPAASCSKPHNHSSSNANTTPLGNRISKPSD